MDKKICSTCQIEKLLTQFVYRNGRPQGQCKDCRNAYIKQYKQDRQNGTRQLQLIEITNDGKICKKCDTWKPLSEYPTRSSQHGYRHECKECRQSMLNEYYQTTYNEVRRERKKTDIQYKILCNHRHYVYKCLTRYSLKCTSSINYIGCTVEQLKLWLEFMFSEDMSWDNYGTIWSIDHVIPLSLFDLADPQQQLIAFHWSNMQPSKDNFKKGNKFRMWEYVNTLVSATRFIRMNEYPSEWYQGLRESLNWLRNNSDMVKIH